MKIPPEIWIKIFENLSVRDMCNVMLVSDLFILLTLGIYAVTLHFYYRCHDIGIRLRTSQHSGKMFGS